MIQTSVDLSIDHYDILEGHGEYDVLWGGALDNKPLDTCLIMGFLPSHKPTRYNHRN